MRSDEKLIINITMSIKVQYLLSITPFCNRVPGAQLGYCLMLLMERIEPNRHSTLI